MTSSMMNAFCKCEACPSSHELLGFQNGDLAMSRGREIRKHLRLCEFCAAEVEFYSHYPQEEGMSPIAEIPAPLFELAEALLRNRHGDASLLYSLFDEKGEVVIDNV